MPEWVEVTSFSRFLNIFSLFVGPIYAFDQRLTADASPVGLRGDIPAKNRIKDFFLASIPSSFSGLPMVKS